MRFFMLLNILHGISSSSDVGRVLDIMQRISPELVDFILANIGFVGQRTAQPKSEDAPDNVFTPISGYDKVKGEFDNLAIPTFLDRLEMNPALKWGVIAMAGLGIAASLGGWHPGDDV
jgi:hypothetical protein